jgi:hypothetical protein
MTDKTFFKPKWRLLLLYTKTIIKGSPAGRKKSPRFGYNPEHRFEDEGIANQLTTVLFCSYIFIFENRRR